MEFVPEFIRRGKKVIDLSADFRFKDAATYETHYQPHTAKDLLEKAVYGLCEINFDKIKDADLVGVSRMLSNQCPSSIDPLVEARSPRSGFNYCRFEIRCQRSGSNPFDGSALLRSQRIIQGL